MLEPDRRLLLIDALTPPAGMTVEYAVGTTFSLDLEALLIAPVAFALFDTRIGEHGELAATDPLSLMEAVRRHANRMDIFCQAGQIAIPRTYQPILALLEESIHPSAASRRGRLFHPKVWALRFIDVAGKRAYRVLCMSRNLTFDRSWDVMVRLDGEPTGSVQAGNQPLVDFVAALPDLSIRPMEERSDRVRDLADELSTVAFEVPDGFYELRFHPAGIDGYRGINVPEGSRRLVISPFLAPKALAKLAGSDSTLISRPESLDRISGDVLAAYRDLYHLADGSSDSEADEIPNSIHADESLAESPITRLSGLHAKVIVTDQGRDASLLVGSANATEAGIDGNVELMVELLGRKAKCGIDSVLGEGEGSLFSLLERYRRNETAPVETSDAERVAHRLDNYGRDLARLTFTARVEEPDEPFNLRVTADEALPPSDVSIRMWPITLQPDTQSAEPSPGEPVSATFTGLSLTAITSFIAWELTLPSDDGPVSVRIVTNARLVGAPEDRHQRILTAQLQSRADVVRYLLLLLAAIGDESAQSMADAILGHTGEGAADPSSQVPLLESMVRALSRSPEALDHVARLIDDLASTEEGQDLLPDGLAEVWEPIWAARQELRV